MAIKCKVALRIRMKQKPINAEKCFRGSKEMLYWKHMAIWMKYMSILWQLFFSFCKVVLAWHPCCQLYFSNALLIQTYFSLYGFQGQGILDAQCSWLNGLDVNRWETVLSDEMLDFLLCPEAHIKKKKKGKQTALLQIIVVAWRNDKSEGFRYT